MRLPTAHTHITYKYKNASSIAHPHPPPEQPLRSEGRDVAVVGHHLPLAALVLHRVPRVRKDLLLRSARRQGARVDDGRTTGAGHRRVREAQRHRDGRWGRVWSTGQEEDGEEIGGGNAAGARRASRGARQGLPQREQGRSCSLPNLTRLGVASYHTFTTGMVSASRTPSMTPSKYACCAAWATELTVLTMPILWVVPWRRGRGRRRGPHPTLTLQTLISHPSSYPHPSTQPSPPQPTPIPHPPCPMPPASTLGPSPPSASRGDGRGTKCGEVAEEKDPTGRMAWRGG